MFDIVSPNKTLYSKIALSLGIPGLWKEECQVGETWMCALTVSPGPTCQVWLLAGRSEELALPF